MFRSWRTLRLVREGEELPYGEETAVSGFESRLAHWVATIAYTNMDTANYFSQKITDKAVHIDETTLGELVADAAEEVERDVEWSEQGEIHGDISDSITDAAREAAKDELLALEE